MARGDAGCLYPIIIGLVLLTLFFVGPATMTSTEDGVRAAENAGYTDVEVQDSIWFMPTLQGCGQGDGRAVKMSAVNPAGNRVDITACVGWIFKGDTIRL